MAVGNLMVSHLHHHYHHHHRHHHHHHHDWFRQLLHFVAGMGFCPPKIRAKKCILFSDIQTRKCLQHLPPRYVRSFGILSEFHFVNNSTSLRPIKASRRRCSGRHGSQIPQLTCLYRRVGEPDYRHGGCHGGRHGGGHGGRQSGRHGGGQGG